jgi:hypothetical protein
MKNTVNYAEQPNLFEDITEFSIHTDSEHRRGSNYYRWDIIEFKSEHKEYFPEVKDFEQYVGTWKTNTILDDWEHGSEESFSELYRVEKKEVLSYEWVGV